MLNPSGMPLNPMHAVERSPSIKKDHPLARGSTGSKGFALQAGPRSPQAAAYVYFKTGARSTRLRSRRSDQHVDRSFHAEVTVCCGTDLRRSFGWLLAPNPVRMRQIFVKFIRVEPW